MYKPKLYDLDAERDVIMCFNGYENRPVISENSFCAQKNMSSDSYPALSSRNPRDYFSVRGKFLHGLFAKSQICYMNENKFYYGGEEVRGLRFSEINRDRFFVSLGAKLLIFPDKIYVNTADLTDYGNLEASFQTKATVNGLLCKVDGTAYEGYAISETPPENPENEALWFDTTSGVRCLKQYSGTLSSWIVVPETYVKLYCDGIGKPFEQYDSVNISGLNGSKLNGNHIIRAKGDDFIVITGAVSRDCIVGGGVTVERKIPDMDFVCESGNRIWGCSSARNEIYASKLGDPTNFNVFTGLSTDSYAVSVGSDGDFTGAISYRGYVLFFKENCVHKIYGQNPPYTVTTSYIRGVQKGCEHSLVCMNETLYYKSPTGICSYEGGVPICISEALGDERYSRAVGGTCGNKYYVCMSDRYGFKHLFVYDESKGIWSREDDVDVRRFATHNSNLYMLVREGEIYRLCLADGDNVYGPLGGVFSSRSQESDVEWYAETGIWGLSLPENKYYSNISLRLTGSKGATVEVKYQINSEGKWITQISRTFEKTGSLTVPFISPRCDHIKLRIKGTGKVTIYSIGRKIESGSELNV